MFPITPGVGVRAFVSLTTLYMLLILLRWVGAWIELDLHNPRLRWIPVLTDPLIGWVRRILPAMGPFDFAPLAALLGVWLLRELIGRSLLVHWGI